MYRKDEKGSGQNILKGERRVAIKDDTPKRTGHLPEKKDNWTSLLVILLGLAVFTAGCGVALYRQTRTSEKVRLEEQVEEYLLDIISSLGGGEGIHIDDLRSGSDILPDPPDNTKARIRLSTMDGHDVEVFVPERGPFPSKDTETAWKFVPIDTGASVVPGRLEVALVAE